MTYTPERNAAITTPPVREVLIDTDLFIIEGRKLRPYSLFYEPDPAQLQLLDAFAESDFTRTVRWGSSRWGLQSLWGMLVYQCDPATGHTNPTRDVLLRTTGWSRSTLSKWLRKLRHAGWISTV